MKSFILAMALALGFSGAAAAADAVEDIVVVDEGYNWSGVYIGVQAGYGWGNNEYEYGGEGPDFGPVDFDSEGFVGGLTAGVNWQNGAFVYGLEADISYSDVDGSVLTPQDVAPCYVEGCSANVEWFATGRGRLGYGIDNFLPYITGGFAIGRVEGTAGNGACGFPPDAGSCSYDDTEFGWTAGAGVEWGLTQQISLKAEYLHVDFGTPDFNNIDLGFASVSDLTLDTVRIGLNYRF